MAKHWTEDTALLDSIAFGHREIVDNFRACGLEIGRIILCGGIANKNELLLQIMADVLNRPIDVSAEPQATAHEQHDRI